MTTLENLKKAFREYMEELLNDGKEDYSRFIKADRNQISEKIRQFSEASIPHMLEIVSEPISAKRAVKLKENLRLSLLQEFDYSYSISQNCAKFIANNFKEEEGLVFDIISIPTQKKKSLSHYNLMVCSIWF